MDFLLTSHRLGEPDDSQRHEEPDGSPLMQEAETYGHYLLAYYHGQTRYVDYHQDYMYKASKN